MSVNRSPLLREIFQISYQGQCEKHFLICLQSEDCDYKVMNLFRNAQKRSEKKSRSK